VYLNGGAKHPLEVSDFDPFIKAFGDGMLVERIDPPPQPRSWRGLAAGLLLVVAAVAVLHYLAAQHQ
jgi:hypothetical protein